MTIWKHRMLAVLLPQWELLVAPLGIDRYIRLFRLLDTIPVDATANTLSQILCPILATSEEEQILFFDLFEQYKPDFDVPELEQESDKTESNKTIERANNNNTLGKQNNQQKSTQPKKYEESSNTKKNSNLILDYENASKPPVTWNIAPEADKKNIFDTGEGLRRTMLQLRQREYAQNRELDMPATIRYSIQQIGMLKFKYRLRTRPAEYLILVERFSSNDHRAALFNTLHQTLKTGEVLTERFFYDGDLNLCRNEQYPEGLYLHELNYKYSESRLLILGSGYNLINTAGGELTKVSKIIQRWNNRLLLTPIVRSKWGKRERLLSKIFTILPAAIPSLQYAAENQDGKTTPYDRLPEYLRVIAEAAPVEIEGNVMRHLMRQFNEHQFNWIAACAVYPGLYYNLTLAIGHVVEKHVKHPLVNAENLLKIARLTWFTEGKIPADIREDLVNFLQQYIPELYTAILEYLTDLMLKNPPPEKSIAWADHQIHLAIWKFQQGQAISQDELKELKEFLTIKQGEKTRLSNFVIPKEWEEKLLGEMAVETNEPNIEIVELQSGVRVLIIPALPKNYQAIIQQMDGPKSSQGVNGTIYDIGIFNGIHQQYQIILSGASMDNYEVSSSIKNGIEFFNPHIILLIGNAEGTKDVNIGDVVIGNELYQILGVGSQTLTPIVPLSKIMTDQGQLIKHNNEWKNRLPINSENDSKIIIGSIASSNNVSEIKKKLQLYYADSLSYDIYSTKFAEIIQPNQELQALVIQAITDKLDSKPFSPLDVSAANLAPDNAAAVAFELLFQLDAHSLLQNEEDTNAIKNKGLALYRDRKLIEAKESFEQLLAIQLKRSPKDQTEIASIYYQLGIIEEDESKVSEAYEYYKKAIQIYEKHMPISDTLADVYWRSGNLLRSNLHIRYELDQEGIKYLEKALQIYVDIMNAFVKEGNNEQAVNLLNSRCAFQYSTFVHYAKDIFERCTNTKDKNSLLNTYLLERVIYLFQNIYNMIENEEIIYNIAVLLDTNRLWDAAILANQLSLSIDRYERLFHIQNSVADFEHKVSQGKLKGNDYKKGFDLLSESIINIVNSDSQIDITNNTYDDIRTEVNRVKTEKKVLTFTEFEALCRAVDTTEARIMQNDANIQQVTDFLHETGCLICYRFKKDKKSKKLDNFVFIDSGWVTDTIYKILDEKTLRNDGEFDKKHVISVLEKERNDLLNANLWIELMQEFELIFAKKDQPDQFIAPQYLPKTCKDLSEKSLNNLVEELPYQLVLHYPEFLSHSNISRFICRYGNLVKDEYWKYGIILHQNNEKMYVVCDYEAKNITIRSAARYTDFALELLDVLKNIDNTPTLEIAVSDANNPKKTIGPVNFAKLQQESSKEREQIEWRDQWFGLSHFKGLFRHEKEFFGSVSHFKTRDLAAISLETSTPIAEIMEVPMEANSRNFIPFPDIQGKISLLYLAASPTAFGQLNTGREGRFKDLIKYFDEEKRFNLIEQQGITKEQFRNFVLSDRPHIVHYGGHGTTEGILLEDGLLKEAILLGILKISPNTQCVILNASNSLEIALELAKHIPYIVGTRYPIPDATSIKFARGFYQALVSGYSVEDAFQSGILAVQANELPNPDVLVLVKGVKVGISTPVVPPAVTVVVPPVVAPVVTIPPPPTVASQAPNTAKKAFFSYSKKDRAYLDAFLSHLAPLRRNRKIQAWEDHLLKGGEEWDAAIKQNLAAADLIFLLLSPDFLNTDYIWDVEIKTAMERHERGEAIIIPIVLRPCDWKDLIFSKLNALPSKGTAISTYEDKDAAWLDVVLNIEKVLGLEDLVTKSIKKIQNTLQNNKYYWNMVRQSPRDSVPTDPNKFITEALSKYKNFINKIENLTYQEFAGDQNIDTPLKRLNTLMIRILEDTHYTECVVTLESMSLNLDNFIDIIIKSKDVDNSCKEHKQNITSLLKTTCKHLDEINYSFIEI